MNAPVHQVGERGIDHAVTLDGRAALECLADDVHAEVTLTLSRMTDVLLTVVDYIYLQWREGGLQALANLLLHRFVHAGNALRKGLISTLA